MAHILLLLDSTALRQYPGVQALGRAHSEAALGVGGPLGVSKGLT